MVVLPIELLLEILSKMNLVEQGCFLEAFNCESFDVDYLCMLKSSYQQNIHMLIQRNLGITKIADILRQLVDRRATLGIEVFGQILNKPKLCDPNKIEYEPQMILLVKMLMRSGIKEYISLATKLATTSRLRILVSEQHMHIVLSQRW